MTWKCYIEVLESDGVNYRIAIRDDLSPWRLSICRIANFLGDTVSAGRRKTWPLDRFTTRYRLGAQLYSMMRSILLYGKIQHGWTWVYQCSHSADRPPDGIRRIWI